jgi:biopolymer transport protein ExbD
MVKLSWRKNIAAASTHKKSKNIVESCALFLLVKNQLMATIIPQPPGKSKTKLHAVKIDMTPMVDLGFLLITFFIFTTSLTQPTVTKLNMPNANIGVMKVYKKALFTAVLDKDKVFVYEGEFKEAVAFNAIKQTDYNVSAGLGNAIRQKQKALQPEGLKDDLMVLIKPLPSASYQDVINALDEMKINGVSRYGIVDASPVERDYISVKHP